MSIEVSFLAAMLAGVLSISSPCVLPLVPIYLAHLAGSSFGLNHGINRQRVLANALAYIAGFSVVFIAMGVALGAAGTLVASASVIAINREWLSRLGGILLVLLGLSYLGIIRLPFLDRDRRFNTSKLPTGQMTTSFLVGVTFAAGWSPCVGPILGAILTMAAGQGDVRRAAMLLAAYSAGLAVPFLIAAFAFGSNPGMVQSLNRRLPLVTGISGGVMVAVGAIMILGIYQQFFATLVAAAPWAPWEPRFQ